MTENQIRLAMTVLISLTLLGVGMYVLIGDSGSSDNLQKAATGWIGVVIGYWLK